VLTIHRLRGVGRVVVAQGGGDVSLERLQNGDLLVISSGEPRLTNRKGVVRLLRSTDQGRTWTEETNLAEPDAGEAADYYAALGMTQISSDTILAPYGKLISWIPDLKLEAYLRKSRDSGKSWSEPINRSCSGLDLDEHLRQDWRAE
jgi:hypothetical protein